MNVLWLILMCFAGLLMAWAEARASGQDRYPNIPEPMVFDMMRLLGAHKGEFETNAFGSTPLSGPDHGVSWAPEMEYAFMDGMAVEFEFPFENEWLAEYKLGLQATLGSFNGGRSAHGVQYMGIYDRTGHTWRNTLVYLLGHRFNGQWSTMNMLGMADISLARADQRNGLILNHSTFYNLTEQTVLGIEINYQDGYQGHLLVMPQIHQELGQQINLQLGIGANKNHHESSTYPEVGLRLVRQF